MSAQDQWTAVDRYFNDLLVGPDAALDAALAPALRPACRRSTSRPTRASCCTCSRRDRRATILEIGTLGGYSTIWLARALPRRPDGSSRSSSTRSTPTSPAPTSPAPARRPVDLRVGRAIDTLPQLAQREAAAPFDLVFIDADKAEHRRLLRLGAAARRARAR